MKYAFMSFSTPDLTLDETLALAKRLGYDGIEPRLAEGHKHGIETSRGQVERQRIKEKVAGSGIQLACLATSSSFADPRRVKDMVDETRRCIDLAADLGSPRLRVFGGSLPSGVSREDALDGVSRALSALAGQAQERGVTLCLETHDAWTNPAHVVEVMRRVNGPFIAVNWDIMHPVRQSKVTMDEVFQTLRPWIRHVHFHDGVDSTSPNNLGGLILMPVGQGVIDHKRAVQLLKAADYDGYLSGEWIGWEPYQAHLPRELATMKAYES